MIASYTSPTPLAIDSAHRLFRRNTWPAPSDRVVTFHDAWRATRRVVRFHGMCVGCGAPTWAADDGENDPRGVLGDHALAVVYTDDGQEVRACHTCANTEATYRRVLVRARQLGTDAAPEPALLDGEVLA